MSDIDKINRGSRVELLEDYRGGTYVTPKGAKGTVVHIFEDQELAVVFSHPDFWPRGRRLCNVTLNQIKLVA